MKWGCFLLVFSLTACQHTVPPNRDLAQEKQDQQQRPEKQDKSQNLVFLDHKFFKVVYDKEHRLPQQVEYTLTKPNLKLQIGKRTGKFRPDPLLLKMKLPSNVKGDIEGALYDKGHMAPADDFKQSQDAIDATFVMTNVAPQKAELNQNSWRVLEGLVQGWGCGESEIRVITGSVLKPGLPKLRSGISVPDKFFKAVFDLTAPVKSICFIYDQTDDRRVTPEDRMMSVRD